MKIASYVLAGLWVAVLTAVNTPLWAVLVAVALNAASNICMEEARIPRELR